MWWVQVCLWPHFSPVDENFRTEGDRMVPLPLTEPTQHMGSLLVPRGSEDGPLSRAGPQMQAIVTETLVSRGNSHSFKAQVTSRESPAWRPRKRPRGLGSLSGHRGKPRNLLLSGSPRSPSKFLLFTGLRRLTQPLPLPQSDGPNHGRGTGLSSWPTFRRKQPGRKVKGQKLVFSLFLSELEPPGPYL